MTLALYRTYRPGSLAEVIGQEHVTAPLGRALDGGRVHHAYLFSGPRGCGKTSTARILARSLNCAQGPSSTPCGTCRSCVDLAPNGPGSIDVVEMDAATHRGIDDARDLREKAIYAPAASPFKVYIIDEAHQLTNEAANALLKLVEEPPAHLRFIFATTEPDKIIPTIRSRTFHYGFRLVPARVLTEHLSAVCRSEGVPAEPAALGIVARAGAGSVRDSLSVLGQLLAGAGPEGLTYAGAVSTLGLTDSALIDSFLEALAAGSAAGMFIVVDSVISSGHDPRRFVADVLDRLRDLIILRADPSAAAKGLLDLPDEAVERMTKLAQSLGLAELSHAADLVSAGLGEMKGATAPRLQLELLCTRVVLPSGGRDTAALAARLDRLERWAARTGTTTASSGPSAGRAGGGEGPGHDIHETSDRPAERPGAGPANVAGVTSLPEGPPAPPRRPALRAASSDAPSRAQGSERPEPSVDGIPAGRVDEGGSPPAPAPAAQRAGGGQPVVLGLSRITSSWPEVLDRLAAGSRVAWTAFHSATPLSLSDGVLAVALAEPGNIRAIAQRGHDERLRQAILDVLGLDVTIDVVHSPDAVRDAPSDPGGGPQGRAGRGPSAPGPTQERRADTVREASATAVDVAEDAASADDPDLQDAADGLALITRELGARPIGEIDHS